MKEKVNDFDEKLKSQQIYLTSDYFCSLITISMEFYFHNLHNQVYFTMIINSGVLNL